MLMFSLSGDVLADVRETPHNLIRSRDASVSEKQVCVFCHTPSVELADVPSGTSAIIPRWQKALPRDYAFTIFDDIGRMGLGKPSVGSQSIACLSCHDANQAFGVGRTSADHPFGIPYRGVTRQLLPGSVTAVPRVEESGAPFRAARHPVDSQGFREVSQGTIEGREVFWVSRNGVTSRRTRNDLPLYGRVTESVYGASTDVPVPHIECSSCHDPHTQAETFLRVSAQGSQLCLTCHDK